VRGQARETERAEIQPEIPSDIGVGMGPMLAALLALVMAALIAFSVIGTENYQPLETAAITAKGTG